VSFPSAPLIRVGLVVALGLLLALAAPGAAAQVRPPVEVTGPAAAAPTAPAAPSGSTWGWPLPGRPAVLHRFQPPPAPWLAGHRGVDLAGSPGTPVLAAGAGVVAFAGSVAGVPVVSVDHSGGLRTTYQPVVAAVARGEPIARGEPLGTLVAAPSHCLPASCLHWGLRRGDAYLDPLSLVGLDLRVRLLPVWAP